MNKKLVVFGLFVFVTVVLANCNLPTNQQGYSGKMMNEPMYNEEMPFEDGPGEPQEFFDPDAEHPEELQKEWNPEEPLQEENPEGWAPEELDPNDPIHIAHFVANPSEIGSGDCSLLEWFVEGPAVTFLDGQNVGHGDTMQVCPKNTTTYRLVANANGQELSREVTVSVINGGQSQSSGNNNQGNNSPQKDPTKTNNSGGMVVGILSLVDLKVDEIYPSSSGQIMVRIKNVGTEDVNNNIKLSCQSVQTTQAENQVWPPFEDKTITISLQPGQYTDYETGYGRNPDIKTMQVSCQITPPSADWYAPNDELNNVKVK
jgi:hypothetical protein